MIKRTLEKSLIDALNVFPIVLLSGARQVGKSTLALHLYKNYLTFDDIEMRLYAKENPKDFLESLELPICLDEIQKVPSILEYIKIEVDKHQINGAFLLTGSANVLDHKEVKDTLAGRLIELKLFPLSLKEKSGKPQENIIEKILNKDFKLIRKDYSSEIVSHILEGGYPKVLNLNDFQRNLWYKSYISTYIERDARDLANIRDIESFIRFVNILASRSATLLNVSSLSREVGIKDATTQNYISIMNKIFQITLVKPYYTNIGKQFVKSPKLFFNDTGVLTTLLQIDSKEALLKTPYSGQIYETFVFSELIKHISYLQESAQIYHYRTNDKKEIDFIIEARNKILAIEVKQSKSVKKEDFKHIIDFQSRFKGDILGIVFYNGEIVRKFNENLIAIPFGYFL